MIPMAVCYRFIRKCVKGQDPLQGATFAVPEEGDILFPHETSWCVAFEKCIELQDTDLTHDYHLLTDGRQEGAPLSSPINSSF